ncbi:uncharacterized protein J3D65DRAFT_107818 [Phyllosticta citribraziliensis]|uniref:Uncharacterized protein n=1 Tax=Phyllosticta citribraziliensis TaxID=989973 RepID=A0ABR1LB54_9PEZI
MVTDLKVRIALWSLMPLPFPRQYILRTTPTPAIIPSISLCLVWYGFLFLLGRGGGRSTFGGTSFFFFFPFPFSTSRNRQRCWLLLWRERLLGTIPPPPLLSCPPHRLPSSPRPSVRPSVRKPIHSPSHVNPSPGTTTDHHPPHFHRCVCLFFCRLSFSPSTLVSHPSAPFSLFFPFLFSFFVLQPIPCTPLVPLTHRCHCCCYPRTVSSCFAHRRCNKST